MIAATTIQEFLKTAGGYTGLVDGVPGPATMASVKVALRKASVNVDGWPNDRLWTGIIQLFLNRTNGATLTVDGVSGQKTNDAIYIFNTTLLRPIKTFWPRQADVPKFFGAVGKNQVMVQVPAGYAMFGDYGRKIKVPHFSAHKKVAPSIERILARTLDHYGAAKIRAMNLDIFSGCLNVRRIRGGTGWSMHSWGIAVDIDAAHNELNYGRDRARMDNPEYAPFVNFWEEEGWVSLGRARNYDWMHFQAARL